MIKAFIFDWAGTMVDFGCMAPVRALQAVFAAEGVPLSDAEARADMGMAKHAHIAAMLGRAPLTERWTQAKGQAPKDGDIDRLFAAVGPQMREAADACSELIVGAASLAAQLRDRGVRIGSGTGYSRDMMTGILPAAAAQGYAPEVVVCAGETVEGRPSPLMTWKALVDLGVWPSRACVKVDDAVVGIIEGCEAGVWTIGVAASGNGVGLDDSAFNSLDAAERDKRVRSSAREMVAAGADYVVSTVADIQSLLPELESRIAAGELPGSQDARVRL